MKRLVLAVGARPNFMKAAPILRALDARGGWEAHLVHTGQHYDPALSDAFFRDLNLPKPTRSLDVGSGSHGQMTGRVLERFEAALLELKPDWVVVVGDVNSTLACALAAVKLHIRAAHVEAGLRSFDRRMAEEHNRVLTDHLCDLLLTTAEDDDANLAREGIPSSRVRLVGDTMIDTLLALRGRFEPLSKTPAAGWEGKLFAVATAHRPENVDGAGNLAHVVEVLEGTAARLPTVLSLHPRTKVRLQSAGLWGRLERSGALRVVEPLGYLAFMGIASRARVLVTDSGSLQQEGLVLGVPCLTMRENTERPITVRYGANRLVGTDPAKVLRALDEVLSEPVPRYKTPPFWDGRAGERIAAALEGA
ncbi:MAG: UDP-N-acetylglucosamine 2-epimerase (non-hydrolyzing) [Planctomycetes bacterium]|nr:UDP-N-acetylglucosamine 2-epimerase (non-hydrolyzing) [Planctomycetota bacterium]